MKLGYKRYIILIAVVMMFLCGCGTKGLATDGKRNFANWNEVLNAGKKTEVTILMWGGNDQVNRYMDDYVSKNVKAMYGITFKRVPMDASMFMSKLLNEKKSNVKNGTADMLWINGENFRTAKATDLLWGPFINLLPNISTYYDKKAADLLYDSGISIDGYEGIWGRAQLVLTYDSAVTKNPPTNFKELLVWAKKNPGKFTYPRINDDFAGAAFIRTAYYELTGKKDIFQKNMTQLEFEKLSIPVVNYFKELNKYLWNGGRAYPASQAQMDNLFKNGEISMTMGFEIGKTSGQVAAGIYPKSVKTYVLNTGTIGNSHYLAIPYNAQNIPGALLVMDFLESPKAQLEKLKASVWGDMPGFEVKKLDVSQRAELTKIEATSTTLSMKVLTTHRLPEMKSIYIDWIKEIWMKQIRGKE